MNNYTRICARVDLDAIEYNMEMMKKNIKEGVQMISVIKTDGYGHGALQIARMLEGKEYLWAMRLLRWMRQSFCEKAESRSRSWFSDASFRIRERL